jgi:hypothetical protein
VDAAALELAHRRPEAGAGRDLDLRGQRGDLERLRDIPGPVAGGREEGQEEESE